ncbi:MAG TPA: hypothetical protein VFV41_15445, partial [Streptosporangiaceae bacterium]|nr:hypothetical protein [Streptosporangiaceae bacterium]
AGAAGGAAAAGAAGAGQGDASGSGDAAATAAAGSEAVPGPGAGPPTEAVSVPGGRRSSRPGRAGPGGPGGDGPGGGYGGGEDAGGYRQPWWRSKVALIAAAVVVVVGGGGAAYALVGSNAGGGGAGGTGAAAGMKVPGCTTANAQASELTKVRTDTTTVGGNPFAVRESRDHAYTFITINDGIAVLRNNGNGTAPSMVRTYSVPNANKGMALTRDGRYLLAAGGPGAVVIDVAQAEQGAANPVVGELKAPRGTGGVGVVVSPDGKYAFVTLQETTHMAVFNLAKALSNGFAPSSFVGFVPLGVQPVGVTFSADNRWLYVTSFQRKPGPEPAPGTLSVVSVPGAEKNPATSVKHVVGAGCSPARVTTDGSNVWVTARDSNSVLGYSAARLLSDPQHALAAIVKVGPGPIGISFTPNGKELVVADSNQATRLDGSVAVVSISKALAGKPALLGVIPARGQPRQLTVADRGQSILATLQRTADVMGIRVSDLP